MSFSGNSYCPPTMFLQSMLQKSSNLGRLGAVTLAASRVASCTIDEAQKLVQLSGVWNK